jgi:hypothetical protein
VQNYLLMAHVAALRLLLRRYADNMPRTEVGTTLEHAFASMSRTLGAAPPAEASASGGRTASIATWPGWAPLQRQLHLLQQDAAQVALSSAAIDDVLGRTDHRPASKTARAGWN